MLPCRPARLAALFLALGSHAAPAVAWGSPGSPSAAQERRVDRPRTVTSDDRESLRPEQRFLGTEEAVARGRATLERSQHALGALAGIGKPGAFEVAVPIHDVLPALEYQALYTDIVVKEFTANGPVWVVHSRVPVFVRTRPGGDGYSIAEYAAEASGINVTYGPSYTRFVLVDDRSWTERGKNYVRTDKASESARAMQLRNFVLGAWPLAVGEAGTRVAEFDGDPNQLEVRFPRAWQPLRFEFIRDYYVVLDPKTLRPRHLTFSVVASDRSTLLEQVQMAFVDFDQWTTMPLPEALRDEWRERLIAAWRAKTGSEGEPPAADIALPTELALPAEAVLWVEGTHRVGGGRRTVSDRRVWVQFTRHAVQPIPAGGLRFPWQHDHEVWRTDERADHWDPPPRQGPPAPTETQGASVER